MKLCSTCREEKELAAFYKNPRRADGLHNQCNDCAREYRTRNKERKKRYDADRYTQNPQRFIQASLSGEKRIQSELDCM